MRGSASSRTGILPLYVLLFTRYYNNFSHKLKGKILKKKREERIEI
jgi:hypothetical protein